MAKVDFSKNRQDFQALLLGAMGFTTDYIQQRTNLTPGQVGYRLNKAKIKRRDYRTGKSVMANLVLKQTARLAQQLIRNEVDRIEKNHH